MTYIYNWAIWEYPIQKEVVCMAMNQMAPGIQIFEPQSAEKIGPRGRLQSETTKAETNHRDFGCYFGPFPAPSSPSGWHGAKDEFRALASLQKPNAAWQSHIVTWTCPNSCWSPKNDQTKHSYGISVTSRQSPKRAYSWDPCKCGHVSLDLQSHSKAVLQMFSCWSLQT